MRPIKIMRRFSGLVPVIEIPIWRSGSLSLGGQKIWMLRRGVVRDKVHQHADTTGMSLLHHTMEIFLAPIGLVQLKIIDHGISIIAGRGYIYRRQPQSCDAQV